MPLPPPDLPQTEAAIIEMTNGFRGANKLGTVVPNSALNRAAQDFADYLANSNSFAHTADGRQPSDRARAAGYRYCIVAENLALSQTNGGYAVRSLADFAITGWKNSPPHREAMLHPYVTDIGIGIAKSSDSDPKYLLVQLLGRPETLRYEIAIENRAGATINYQFGTTKNVIENAMQVKHTACVPTN